MNKTKKCILAALVSVFCGCMTAFAACQLADKTVTFMDGDAVYTQVSGKTGEEIDPITVPIKTGYEFSGWRTESGEEFVPDKIPAQDVSVYAGYAANNYKIVLDPNGGNGVAVTLDAVYDETVNIVNVEFTKNGYDLTGWAKTSDAEAAEYGKNDGVKNLTSVKNETVTLYAYYTPQATDENGFVINETTVTAYLGDSAKVTLPKTCTAIGEGAFANNHALKEVIIPETYTEIGFGAFEGCDNLEKITLPFIGGSRTENTFLAYVFGAANYKDNNFAYNLTQVGTGDATVDESSLTGSFYIPRSLRIVVINSAIDKIPDGAFYYAYGLEKVIAYRYTDDAEPDSNSVYTYRIREVGESAFEGCHRIGNDAAAGTEYYMAWLSGVEVFKKACFKGYVAQNDYFTSELLTLGELTSVKEIGEEAFRYNSKLCDFKFGNNLKSIGDWAFANANLLQKVIIPDSCETIGASAFEQCIYLGSVTIGSGVRTVGDHAFAYSAALTEVFFKNGLPENLASDAFYGLDIDSLTDKLRTDVNPGTVFYFDTQAKATAAEAVLKSHYPTISTGVTKPERGPLYYVGQSYDFMLTFSGGHTVTVSDPLYRIGFGIPELVGTYERKTDVWYGAEIYVVTLMLDMDFTVKIEYYLSAKYTHYYIYRVETFTFDEVRDEITAFTVGDKQNDEWYMEENVYGQIGLWHNGTMVELDSAKGATYCAGGISQFYDDRSPRTLMYRQGNEYFEPVVEYDFIYVPEEGTKDDLLTYYGTLYLNENDQRLLFGTYESGDKSCTVFVDEVIKRLKITKGDEVIINGSYSTADSYGDKKLTLNVADTESGEMVTVYFTDFLDNIVDGNKKSSLYARCNVELNGKKCVMYNNKYASHNECHFITSTGEPSGDYYVLMQYHQMVEVDLGDDSYEYELYPGFGEHVYSVGGNDYHDYLTYNFTEDETGGVYLFRIDNGEPDPDKAPVYGVDDDSEPEYDYKGKIKDSFINSFEAPLPHADSDVKRTYVPYFEDEKDQTFTDGNISITLNGYGNAEYTDEEGNVLKGSYNIVDGTTVKQVYVTSNTYYNLIEYVFKSDDGSTELYFVPNFFDAYDGSMLAGEMYLPDTSRNKVYRVFDKNGWCTAQFSSSGYGMGVLYIMISSDADETSYSTVTAIDNTYFCPGATYAYYTQVGEKDGKPVYRLATGLDKGFFTFQFTNKLSNGHRYDNQSKNFARELAVGDEYDTWWKDPAAKYITGNIDPDVDEMTLMVAREEIGVYTSPNGYTLELDGKGAAVLKKPDGTVVHNATYKSVDDGVLGTTKYTLEYTVGGTTYTGVIDIIDKNVRDNALIILELNVDGVVLNNFARGAKTNYTAAAGSTDYGTLSMYAGGNVGEYRVVSGSNVYNLGEAEYDKTSNNYVFRFNDKKLVVTLSEGDNTYTVVNAYNAIQVKEGEYYCQAYYVWKEDEAMTDKDGNDLTNPDGSIQTYPHCNLYGYEVRAEVVGPITRPVSNPNSEYVRTSINIDPVHGDQYFYNGPAYKADILCYEDGEFIISYNHLDIIQIKTVGRYLAADDPENDTHKALIVLDKGNAICVYMWGDLSVG